MQLYIPASIKFGGHAFLHNLVKTEEFYGEVPAHGFMVMSGVGEYAATLRICSKDWLVMSSQGQLPPMVLNL